MLNCNVRKSRIFTTTFKWSKVDKLFSEMWEGFFVPAEKTKKIQKVKVGNMICVPFVICHPYINNKSNFKYRHLNLHLEVKYLVKYGTEIKVVLIVCSVKSHFTFQGRQPECYTLKYIAKVKMTLKSNQIKHIVYTAFKDSI